MSAWPWTARTRPVLQRRAIEDLARSLSLCIEPDTLRASIARRVKELVDCDRVIVCHHRQDEDDFAADAVAVHADAAPLTFAASGTLSRWLRANQEPLLIPNPQGVLAYLDEQERATLLAADVRVCVPIFASSGLVAILLICAAEPRWRLGDEEVDLVMRLGQQAGLALENAALHRLERDRLKGLHQAQQLAVAGQLAATVAHEVRNPLTAIRSTVQYVIQSSTDWDSKHRLLEQILDEVDRIERTVSGVLALSRPHEFEFVEIDLMRAVEGAFLLINAYAQSHKIAIDWQFDTDTVPIRGDQRALHQVCMNLFLNACQSMPDGGRIVVHCGVWSPAVDAKPLARLQIADTGSGIRTGDMARVFDPFFTTKRAGTGLGLPICLDIVAEHGGTLRLHSEEGRGTAATVLLPLRTI